MESDPILILKKKFPNLPESLIMDVFEQSGNQLSVCDVRLSEIVGVGSGLESYMGLKIEQPERKDEGERFNGYANAPPVPRRDVQVENSSPPGIPPRMGVDNGLNGPPPEIPKRTGSQKPKTYGSPLQQTIMEKTKDKPFLNMLASTFLGGNSSPQCELTDDQKIQFMNDGFLVLPGIVNMDLVNDAKRSINRFMGKPCSEEDAIKFRNISFGDLDLMTSSEIRNLMYKSGALSVVESLVGRSQTLWAGQIALRFPGYSTIEEYIKQPQLAKGFDFLKLVSGNSQNKMTPLPHFEKYWHVDGLPNGRDVPFGEFHNFSCLIGVILGTVQDINSGNLTLYPGAHLQVQEFFRKNDPTTIANLPAEEFNQIRQKMTRSFQPAHQITGNPGDVIVAHHCMPHTVAPNLSPDIRYAVYFRVTSSSRPEEMKYNPEALTNIWLEYEGIHHLL